MNLRIEQDGRVRRLTMARPERRNVLDRLVAEDLLRELSEAEADPGTRAVLLDADGDVFCGGFDPNSDLPEGIFKFGGFAAKPVVVALKGVAVSAGLALAANAQVAVAAQGSTFGLTDIREARAHPGILEAVAAAIGMRRTRELALTGRIFSTPEALAWGLVHAVTPVIELDDRAIGIAKLLADADPKAVQTILGVSDRYRRAPAG